MATAAVTIYRVNQYDPTRTLGLRGAFAREMTHRFARIGNLIVKAVVNEDVFGMKNPSVHAEMNTPGDRAFAFPRSGEKVAAFMDWLEQQVARGVLDVTYARQLGRAVEVAWTNLYVESAYQRGIRRARQELVNHGYKVTPIEEAGGILTAFNNPFHLDRVGLLYTRVFNDLKGITNAMDQQISRVLSQGMTEGRGPREIARTLVRVITGIGANLGTTDILGRYIPAMRRAQMLARTEIIRAHHVATVQEYRNWGVVGVKVKAEWITAGDDRVCPECADMENKVFDLDEIEGMIPLHPQCRCCAIPVDMEA